MMERSTFKIIWKDDIFKSKKSENEKINSDEYLLARMFPIPKNEADKKKLPKPDSKEFKERKEFCTYKSCNAKVIVWPIYRENKILFRFHLNHFSWNTYETELLSEENYYDCLNDIRNIIVQEFPQLFNGVDFISYIESQRFWEYKHIPFLSI